MLDCQEKRQSTLKSTFFTSFVPRQVLLSSSLSKFKMVQQERENLRNMTISLIPQDRVKLLHTICQFLDVNGFRKTLKKFCGEADIEKSGWKDCSVNLEEMFQEHLRMRTKEIHVEDKKKLEATLENGTVNGDTTKSKKKKKNKNIDCTSDQAVETHLETPAEPVGDTLSEPAKAVKKSKKNKQKDVSDSSEKDSGEQPAADSVSIPSEPLKKSKEKKKKLKDESEVLDKDSQGVKLSKKSDNLSLEEKEEKKEKTKSKKTKEDIPLSKVAVDEDEKRSKKRKKSSADDDDNGTGYDEDNSKRRKMDVTDKSNGFMDKDGVEEAHEEDTAEETNGFVEPTSVKAFQRVKAEEVKFVDDRLKDNSYWAKDGADSGYGAKAQEVLGQVRGRDFRHEKTKKKRGTYRGGQIDLQSHSIKFNYDDEE